MNKAEFISAVAGRAGLSKRDAELAVNAAIDVVIDTLKKDDKLQLVGFGGFEVKTRAARRSVNPKTGAPIDIPASKAPVFKPGKSFKDAVAGR